MEKIRGSKPWLVFLLVSSGVFLSTMDSSMINVALPSIMRSFQATLISAELVILMYLLTITVSLVFWGYLADRFGQGNIYLLGMFVFSVGSILCCFSPFLQLLVFSRFIQAMGASMMMSAGPAIIKHTFSNEHLGQSLGLLGVATSMGLMSGPVISGVLIRYANWRAIFLVTVPVSLTALIVGRRAIAGNIPSNGLSVKTDFDWAGSLLWTILISLFVVTVYSAKGSGIVGGILLVFLMVLTAIFFFRREQRSVAPMMPLFLFKRRNFSVAVFTATISFVVLFIVLILIPFFMEYILGASSDTIGYVMMAVPVTLFILSPASGWLYDKIGPDFLTAFGLLLCSLAVVLLCTIDATATPFSVAWRLALLGAGQSIFLSPNTASVLSVIEIEKSGIASGVLATSRNIGMLIGVGLAGAAFSFLFSHFSGGLDLKDYSPLQDSVPFLRAYQCTLSIGALLAFIAALVSVFMRSEVVKQGNSAESRK